MVVKPIIRLFQSRLFSRLNFNFQGHRFRFVSKKSSSIRITPFGSFKKSKNVGKVLCGRAKKQLIVTTNCERKIQGLSLSKINCQLLMMFRCISFKFISKIVCVRREETLQISTHTPVVFKKPKLPLCRRQKFHLCRRCCGNKNRCPRTIALREEKTLQISTVSNLRYFWPVHTILFLTLCSCLGINAIFASA